MRLHPISMAFALALLLAACGDGPTLSEADLLGAFELVRMDGRGLPVELWGDSLETGVLQREELEFHPAGRVDRSYRLTITPLAGGEAHVSDITYESEYRIQGRRVEIGRFEPCPPNAWCIPNDVGELRAGHLEIHSGRWGGVTVLYAPR